MGNRLNEDELNLEHSRKKKRSKDSLTASGIAEYIRFNCCPRFFKLRLQDDEEAESHKWPTFKPISPLLYGVGKTLEEKKVSNLKPKQLNTVFIWYVENERASFNFT
jgi:hypothetical protein